uniref:Ig-like domain-containing protein n=1 Tax=Chelydra serpentina TaxID=8475 RepID=A0A8C3T9L3_CHESE
GLVFSRPECLFLALLLSDFEQATSLPQMEVAAISGESVQLQPVKLPEPWAEMTWKVTLDSAEMYRIVTFNKGEHPDLGSSPHFISRVTFHPENLSLQIDAVNKSDSGLYTLEADPRNGRVDITTFRVSPVPKPSVNVTIRASKDGWCNVTLTCIVDVTQVSYRWYKNEKDLVGKINSTLDVQLTSESEASYKCIVSNPVSEETGFIYYRSPCTWNGNIHLHSFILLQRTVILGD